MNDRVHHVPSNARATGQSGRGRCTASRSGCFPAGTRGTRRTAMPPKRNAGSTASSSTVSGTSLWNSVFCGNSGRCPGLVRARTQRPAEQPDQHLGERGRGVLHPRRRGDVAAAPGGARLHDAVPKPQPQHARRQRAGPRSSSRPMTRDPAQRGQRGEARARVRQVRRPGRDCLARGSGRPAAGPARSGSSRRPARPSARSCSAETRGRAAACSDRAVPRKTAPYTFTKQATASAPIRASAGAAKAAAGERRPVARPRACRTGRGR